MTPSMNAAARNMTNLSDKVDDEAGWYLHFQISLIVVVITSAMRIFHVKVASQLPKYSKPIQSIELRDSRKRGDRNVPSGSK